MNSLQEFLAGGVVNDGALSVSTAVRLMVYLLLGGVFSMWVRVLYRRFSTVISNREGMSSIFPLLTLTVIVVIFVVKASLALSLGLVGALSIVRFRAAIKEPEELIYLFFCIAMGLALGAERPLVAFVGLIGFSLFVAVRHLRRGGEGKHHLLLTIAGPAQHFMDEGQVLALVDEAIGKHKVQRFDLEDGQVQYRVIVSPSTADKVIGLAATLRGQMPDCRVSFVNLDSLL